MSNIIDLKKGLNIPVSGVAAPKTRKVAVPGIVAVKPTDFRGLKPRLLVKEGDKVLAGSPVLADKESPDILFTSPVSGTVTEVVRGEKRKLLEVRIKADSEQKYLDFGIEDARNLDAGQIKSLLMKSGLWPAIIQRPYGIIANPDIRKLTDGGVHVSLNAANANGTPFHKLENVILHTFYGKHPAGNTGVQIHHISPIMKGETVWTVSPMMLAAIGRLLNTGRYDMSRLVAVTGPKAIEPAYVKAVCGLSMKDISEFYDNSASDIRFISGDVLTGTNVGADGFLGFFDNQITLIKEGREHELLGWAKPFRTKQFSTSRTYFSWLTPKKTYEMDTNLHGGPRAFVMSDVYSKVLPMDIYPVHLIKACLAGDIDKMEQFGIYEVLEEDLALCEYVCPSKIEIQSILSDGIALMMKEMA